GRHTRFSRDWSSVVCSSDLGAGAMAEKSDGSIPFDLPRVTPAEKRRAGAILAALRERHPDAHCELTHSSPHELLIATILSAQCKIGRAPRGASGGTSMSTHR